MTLQVNEPSAKYLVRPQSNNEGVGIPPSGWQIKPLGELSEFITSGSRGWASYYKEHGATFIRSQNVLKGQLDFNDHQCVVPPVGSEGSRTRVEFGDLLITITGNSVGNVAYVDRHLGEAYISQHVGLVRLKDTANAAYICRFLSPGAPGNAQIVSNQSGQSKPGLNLKNLRDFVVSMPPKEEQRAIAAALSDVDALIAGLEKLIAKKRDLKQAAMQQLLTGQTRLPGFSGEWEVKQLGEFARLYQPQTISQDKFSDDGYPVFGANGVVGMYERFNHASPQITISCRGNCGTVNRTSGPTWITGNAMVVNLDAASNVDKGFVYYALTFSDLSVLVTGSGIPQIVRGPLSGFAIKLPKNVAEQTAIATVLSDMDADLSAPEARLAKARAIKQGMMQELLTGRTRLV